MRTDQASQSGLHLLMSRTGAEEAALFYALGGDPPRLLASVGIDQVILDYVVLRWRRGYLHRAGAAPGGGTLLAWSGDDAVVVAYLRPWKVDQLTHEEISAFLRMVYRGVGDSGSDEPQVVERNAMRMRLEQADWNLSAVSRQLGVDRSTLYRRLARLGIARWSRSRS